MHGSGKKCEELNNVPLSLPLLRGADQTKKRFFKLSFYFFAYIELSVGNKKIMTDFNGCRRYGRLEM
jgi:hypothetical protein